MTFYFLKNHPTFDRRWSVCFTIFFLFPMILNAQPGPDSSHTMQLTPNFTDEMQKKTTFELEQYLPALKKIDHVQLLLKALFKGQLFTHHFLAKREEITPYEEVAPYIDNLLNILNTQSPEKIKKFMLDHNFTESDKKLALLYILFNKNPGESIFELMKALNLSVNDTLSFKDIHSPLIAKDLQNSNEVIAVLSHLLAGTGDPEIIKRLLNTDYDSSIKNYLDENILHTFIRLNNIHWQSDFPINPKYKEAFSLLTEHSQQIINEKNILEDTPFYVALDIGDDSICEILRNKGAVLKSSVSKSTKKANSLVTYFTFEPFVTNFIHSIKLTNPEIPPQKLSKLHFRFLISFNHAEDSRLRILTHAFHSDATQTAKDIALILTAILNRDSQLFMNLTGTQKKVVGHKLLYSTDTPPLFVTNFLLEAIRHSFLPAVEYILKHYKEESTLIPENIPSFSLDPLSLSLLTYASLEASHPLKQEAQKIIRVVADHIDVEKNYHFFINIPPISWAIFFGLLEEVRFLHEEKKAELVTYIHNSSQGWQLNLLDYTKAMGFLNLNNYLRSKKEEISTCERNFLH